MARAYVYDMVDTWNAGATTFTAIKMNVTDTASAAGSLLMDLQVGGVSEFKIRKDGLTTVGGFMNTAGFRSTSDGGFYITDSTSPGAGGNDIALVRDAANTLAQRNGTNAQTFRLYNTYTDASNYERGILGYVTNRLTLGHQNAGTGADRSVDFIGQDFAWKTTSGTPRWYMLATGHFVAAVDNTYDIGASGANRPRNLYVAGRANIDGLTVGKGGQTAVTENTAFGLNALNSASLTGQWNTGIGTNALAVTTTGTDNTAVGFNAVGTNTTGTSNTGVGRNALVFNTTGSNNTALGHNANRENTTSGWNTAIGTNSLFYFNTSNNTAVGFEAIRGSTTVANNTGVNLTAVGYRALYNNTSGTENVAVGHQALNQTTTGAANTAVGTNSLYYNTTGGSNTAVGLQALLNNTTASSNVAVGTNALRYVDTSNNTAVGLEALRGSTTVANNTGANNTAVGVQALFVTTSGAENTAVGFGALTSNTTGPYGTAVGLYALRNNTTGSSNIGIGHTAGDVITTGARNTIIGSFSDPSANNAADQVVIGEGLTGKGNDTAFIGGTNGAYNEKNVTTWETTSDARIKKNIVSNTSGLDIINQIQVRNFEYRAPDEITDLPVSAAIQQPGVQLGVIAQELQAVLPGCVTENSTGVLSVSTDPLVWYLINAVKELAAEVKALKGE